MPVDLALAGVRGVLPGGDLGDVQPGAVFRGVVDLQALGQGERLGGFERFVERADGVGVEVVHDQHDGVGVGVVHGQQAFDLVGPVDLGAAGLGVDVAPAPQRFDPDEDRAGAAAAVLVVLDAVTARGGGDRVTGVVEELVGLLVHADHRSARVVATGVDGQHVLHPGDELCQAAGRRDGPALPQMRTKFRFFNTRPIVEWSRSGSSSINATRSSSSRSDHRARPDGGVEQANAINRASTSPVIADGTGGVARRLRMIVASTSPSVSTNRSATERTVVSLTPICRATNTRSAGDPSLPSKASNTRARMIIRAGWAPADTTLVNRSRSAPVRATGNTFASGITPVLSSRGKTAQGPIYTGSGQN